MNGSLGTAVITGATGGIGGVYADRLARRGYDLILVARDAEKLQRLAAHTSDSTNRAVEVIAADLADKTDLNRVERALRGDASVTMLVNNAGIGSHKSLLASDVDYMDEMIRLNVTSVMRLSYAVVPGFVALGRGAIINISSSAAIRPEQLNGVYGGTKAFVQAFSTSLNQELADSGIRVQCVLPGATATEFWANGGLSLDLLPRGIVMRADDMVDAALAGYDMGEATTIPALSDESLWSNYEHARRSLFAQLSSEHAASRFRVGK